MKPFTRLNSCTAVLAHENIDTDRIIPARFLTTTGREGLGRHAFHDWRYQADGTPDPAFPLNHFGRDHLHIRAVEVQVAMAIEHQVKAAQFPARRGSAPAATVLAHMQDGGVEFQAAEQPAHQSVGIRMHGMAQAKAASYGAGAPGPTTDFA